MGAKKNKGEKKLGVQKKKVNTVMDIIGFRYGVVGNKHVLWRGGSEFESRNGYIL